MQTGKEGIVQWHTDTSRSAKATENDRVPTGRLTRRCYAEDRSRASVVLSKALEAKAKAAQGQAYKDRSGRSEAVMILSCRMDVF